MSKIEKRKQIISHLIRLKEEEIKALEDSHNIFAESADLDEESVLQDDDFSKQDQSRDAARDLSIRIKIAKENLANFKNVRPQLIDEITNGNVVLTDKVNFVIGLALKDFSWNDEKYIGISVDAPIFSELKFKNEGDEFSFNGEKYIIKEIL